MNVYTVVRIKKSDKCSQRELVSIYKDVEKADEFVTKELAKKKCPYYYELAQVELK